MAKSGIRLPRLNAKAAIAAALILFLPLIVLVASSSKLQDTRSSAYKTIGDGGENNPQSCTVSVSSSYPYKITVNPKNINNHGFNIGFKNVNPKGGGNGGFYSKKEDLQKGVYPPSFVLKYIDSGDSYLVTASKCNDELCRNYTKICSTTFTAK